MPHAVSTWTAVAASAGNCLGARLRATSISAFGVVTLVNGPQNDFLVTLPDAPD